MQNLLDQFITIKPAERTIRLRNVYVDNSMRSDPVYTIYSDRAIARVMKETEGEPMVIRRAKAFAAVVEEMPTEIFPDEPFVGWWAGSPTAIPVCAEQLGARLEVELDCYKYMDDEDRKILREEIIPYWKGDGNWKRNFLPQYYEMLPPETRRIMYGDPDPGLVKLPIVTRSKPAGLPRVSVKEIPGKTDGLGVGIMVDYTEHRYHIGHSCAGYEKVIRKGFLGIKKDAEERLKRLDYSNKEDIQKWYFLKGVVIAMDAAARIGKRFAASASKAARKEKDPARKAELKKIAKICERVPAHPAETFHEALQSAWFTHIMKWWEVPLSAAYSPGKVDQYLYPCFEKDIREGRITREEAQELIDCWLMRFTQGVAPFIPQSGAAAHMDVGGLKTDGNDATNELSYMFLEGMMHTRMVEPNMGVLVHSKTPDDFLMKACQLCALGTGHPMFLNNDVFVENFLARGTLGGPPVPLELARISGAIGCNEPHVTNYDGDYNVGSSFLHLPVMLELALYDGWSREHQEFMGVRTGDPRKFTTFKQLQEALLKQVAFFAHHCEITTINSEIVLAERYPTVYQSALIEDCIENGVSREAGGARFNFGPFIATAGAVDVGDSLAAIKKLVFEEKKISMAELLEALENDFEGYEDVRRQLLDVPKFGNDDDYVDELVAWVMSEFSKEVVKHKNSRGGYHMPYQNPLAWFVSAGKRVGALPSGRKAGQPLSDSISPTLGMDTHGPTAIFKSVGKIDHVSVFFGQTLNMRLSNEVFGNDHGIYRLASLIRSFVDLKIHHCQFNMVSSEVLQEAQRNPQDYKDLTVRVAGYVAYFTRLGKSVQNAII
ncbi:MAG: pyruvate formate lyase family protein, partial [Syntrophales bacterium]|nr:pyruvate formate lyase family protein [Syntrophales bacterium]